MRGGEIDKLCWDWLSENYGEEIASQYTSHSLVIPARNTLELNDALENLRQILCLVFGPDESFGTTDYHEAREELGLPDGRSPIPNVFTKAFAVDC